MAGGAMEAGDVDYLIVTFIREEFEAVCRRFRVTGHRAVSGTPGTTRIVSVKTRTGREITAAIARTVSAGNVSAQDAVHQLIAEQKPRLVLAVGIAGAVPTSGIFLGDVVLAKEVHNLTLSAETATGREEAAASVYVMNAVKDYVANVTMDDFKQWQDVMVAVTRPAATDVGKAWTGDEEWDDKINKVLQDNAGRSRPKVVDGVIASSDQLVKSQDLMRRRLLIDRRILANDMESVGVAKACEREQVPMLILRCISDIVGHDRSDDWKRYACEAAATCAREIINIDAVDAIVDKLHNKESGLSKGIEGLIASLDAMLARIRSDPVSESALVCPNAYDLFVKLPDKLKRQWAPDLFDTLDRPMKYLGDKALVLKVAEACIACCRGVDLGEKAAECQARARICGKSWVYQRTGKLGLAEEEAKESKRISDGIGSTENLAFCNKCIGRLKRLRAESETDTTVKRANFEESANYLKKAISLFGNLDPHGPDGTEVGDCYSLLGRTYLSAGDLHLAREFADEASVRINVDSKDYLDLRILEGDLCTAGRRDADALAAYEEVINTASKGNYQISEIVARAHLQKGRTLARLGRMGDAMSAYREAEEIWSRFGESDLAAGAKWGSIVASKTLERRTIRLLKNEPPRVRCEAVRLYHERQPNRRRSVRAQRIGADDTVWRNLVKKAKRTLALEPKLE